MKKICLIFFVFFLMAPLIFGGAGKEKKEEKVTAAVPAGKYKEAPMLAELVAKGELPPVDERLPEEPMVVKPVQEVGKYGGSLTVFAVTNEPWNDMCEQADVANAYLLWVESDGTFVPNLAKSFDLADDAKSLVLNLREGAQWSDGAPFTAEDIVFIFEDMHFNDNIQTWQENLEQVARVKKIDDYTVRFEMDNPFPAITAGMVQWSGSEWISFAPKHYLKKWHIKHNPDAEKVAKEEGFDEWWEAFQYHWWYIPTNDIDRPTMRPWMYKDFGPTAREFVRNPYFYQVDVEGQQLPYIDRIIATQVDQELYNLKITAGEADVAVMHTGVENYTLYKENEKAGGYKVHAFPGLVASLVSLEINQNHSDPNMRKVLNDLRFRRALSAAIDREEINKVVFKGLGRPYQATAMPSCSFFKEEWVEYIEHDPDLANSLLDEMGLTERDKNGIRLGYDGKPILLAAEYGDHVAVGTVTSTLELIKEFFQDVGIDLLPKHVTHEMFNERGNALDHIITIHPFETSVEFGSYTWSRAGIGRWCPAWSVWLNASESIAAGATTLADYEGGKLPGEEPPDEVKELRELTLRKPRTVYQSEEYMEVSTRIYDIWNNLYIIGTVGMQPYIYIAKEDLGNIPEEVPYIGVWWGNLLNESHQLFWKK